MDSSIAFYEIETGKPLLEVKLAGDTVWLSQRLMGEAFDKDADTIGLHIKNIYSEGEQSEIETTSTFPIVQQSRPVIILRCQEPFFLRWQQAHRRFPLCMVHRKEWFIIQA